MRTGNNSYSPPSPPSAPAPAPTPTPSAPAPSTPAPSTPAPSTPAPSAPAPSTPAPSAPIQFTPTPSPPIQFTPAPSAPAPSAPAPSTPTPTPTPTPTQGSSSIISSLRDAFNRLSFTPVASAPIAPRSGQSDNTQGTSNSGDRTLPSINEQRTESGSNQADNIQGPSNSTDQTLQSMSEQELETLTTGIETLQTLVREKIEQRNNITPDKLKQLLLEPIKGGAASDANHSDITGGVIQFPTTETEIRDFPIQQSESRDEYRRKLETTLADELLSAENTGYEQSLDLVNQTEMDLLAAVLNHPNKNGNMRADALMKALYDENPFTNTGDNTQVNQFTNGVNQAKAEDNELMVGATRAAGLLQVMAWLGSPQDSAAGKIQDKKTDIVYENHKFFGEGRGRDIADSRDDGTIYKGIVKSENYTTVKDGHKNDEPLTKAQIAHEPEIKLGPKPDPNIDETDAPAWLKDETARTMPFVNSVSGLGMLSSMSDALGLLPDNADEKMQILSLVAAAQLYSVGGHSFHEFMTGVSIGQDAKTWQRPEDMPSNATDRFAFQHEVTSGELPHTDHGFTYESFVNQLSDEVLTRVADAMTS